GTRRAGWLLEMLGTLASTDLIFWDPDNGIEVPSRPFGSRNSSKYVYWAELETAWLAGHSLLVFQHFARRNRQDHARELRQELHSRCPDAAVFTLDSPNVLYLAALQPSHSPFVKPALSKVEWDRHPILRV